VIDGGLGVDQMSYAGEAAVSVNLVPGTATGFIASGASRHNLAASGQERVATSMCRPATPPEIRGYVEQTFERALSPNLLWTMQSLSVC
jgi:hypothetical protein